MQYQELIDIIKTGEGYTIEFKESVNSSIGKDICAFTNSSGGKIIIGVEDKTNKAKEYKLTNTDKSRIQNIARNMSPSFNVQIEQIKNLAVIYVPEGKNKPYIVNGHFYMRYGANSQQLDRDEIRDLFQKENLISFERQIKDFKEKDFSIEAFRNFKKEAGLDKDLSKKHILNNLNLLTNNKLNNSGILFFVKNMRQYLSNATTSCFLYADKEQTEIIDSKEFAEDFISNLNNTYKYLTSKLNTAVIIKDLKHKTKLELPKEALREAIINAMIHRDYFFPANIQINITPDRVEIINPGKLLFPKKELGKRIAQRNPILVDLVHRLGLVEKAGSGIKRIKKLMRENNLKIEFETESYFNVIFYRRKSDANQTQIRRKSDVKTRQEWILNYLEENKTIKSINIIRKFNVVKDTASRDLRVLIGESKILKRGAGNNVWYELKKGENRNDY